MTDDDALEGFELMARMRAFDDHVDLMFREGLLRGTAHSYAGMEAVGAAVISLLGPDDYLSSYHRGHGHAIARGLDATRMAHELFGNPEGYCRGKGGSMHITDTSLGMLGANGIIGAGIPIALGAALAAKLAGEHRVAVAFFGDGAANAGVFFECLNMAAIWDAPMLFVCENNGVALTVETETVTAGPSIAARAEPFGIPSAHVDGTDFEQVVEAARPMIERARSGGGPALLECTTVRFGTHSTVSNQETRDQDWVTDQRASRDPLDRLAARLMERGAATEAQLQQVRADAIAEMTSAFEAAEAAERQSIEAVREDVYV